MKCVNWLLYLSCDSIVGMSYRTTFITFITSHSYYVALAALLDNCLWVHWGHRGPYCHRNDLMPLTNKSHRHTFFLTFFTFCYFEKIDETFCWQNLKLVAGKKGASRFKSKNLSRNWSHFWIANQLYGSEKEPGSEKELGSRIPL